MNDDSIMPFGKHKGKKMIDVPDDYLVYIYDNGLKKGSVKTYIEEYLYDKIDKTDDEGVII